MKPDIFFKNSSIIIVILLASALTGCASVALYQQTTQSWLGASAKQLVRHWGYPDHIQQLGNGHELYQYVAVQKGQYPEFINPGSTQVTTSKQGIQVFSMPSTMAGGGQYDFHCKTWFELNREKRIINSAFRGNGCSATKDFAQRFSRDSNLSLSNSSNVTN